MNVGRLLSGVEFDTNLMFGSAYSKTFDVIIGVSKMVRGMDIALKTMRQGEKALVRMKVTSFVRSLLKKAQQ